MSNSTQNDVTRKKSKLVTTVLVLSGAAGVGVFLLMPAIASALGGIWGFDNNQIGEFAFISLAFISLGCVIGMLAGNLMSIRLLLTISLSILVLMEIISPHVGIENYSLFLVIRGISGTAGGVVMAVSTGALAQFPGVERNFGLFLFAQIIISMVGIPIMNTLVGMLGIAAVFYMLATIPGIVILLLSSFLPAVPVSALGGGDGEASEKPRNSAAAWFYCCVVLAGIVAFFIAIGAFWTFIQKIGEGAGLSPEAAGIAISIATVGGALGALMPVFLKDRFGSLAPLLFGFVALLSAVYLIGTQTAMSGFAAAAFAFMFGWYFYHPYQIGVLASVDSDGRPTMASAALIGVGLGLGPSLVKIFGGEGFSGVYLVSTICFVVGVVALISVIFLSGSMSQGVDAGSETA